MSGLAKSLTNRLQTINFNFAKSKKGQEAMKRRRSKRNQVQEIETVFEDEESDAVERAEAVVTTLERKKAKKKGGKEGRQGQQRGGGTKMDGSAEKATIAAPTRRSARRGNVESAGRYDDVPPKIEAKPIRRTGMRSSRRKVLS